MKVLFISNDPTIFEPKSVARARMKTYASAIGELHILSRAAQHTEVQDGNLYLHGLRPLPTIVGRALFFYTLLRHAQALVSRHHIEVVSAQDPFEHGWVAMHAVRATSAKLHIQIHTDFLSPFFTVNSFKNKVRIHIANAVIPKADGIRVVSEWIRHQIIERYGKSIPNPTVISIVVPTATSVHVTQPHYPPLPKFPFTFVLMAIGRLEKEKRIGDSIRVVARLVQKKYPVGLLVVGEGSQRKALKHIANTLGVKDRIIFLGNRSDVSELLKNTAQAFIQTSAYEGYSRTYFEAALSGTPMIVTDVKVMGDVFVHNKSALMCSVGDVECLAEQVATVIEDMQLRHTLAELAMMAVRRYIDSSGDIPKRIADDLSKTISHKREL
ncbi:MAG TPA: glycosyltransferase [Candidatus Kaiserbacteria bacterium]|nr:glycosyltransferase [Candidatus Kaiserbacteria bacterium]